MLFGVNFSYFGYENTHFGFGLPVFAIYWLYKIYLFEEEEFEKLEAISKLNNLNFEVDNI